MAQKMVSAVLLLALLPALVASDCSKAASSLNSIAKDLKSNIDQTLNGLFVRLDVEMPMASFKPTVASSTTSNTCSAHGDADASSFISDAGFSTNSFTFQASTINSPSDFGRAVGNTATTFESAAHDLSWDGFAGGVGLGWGFSVFCGTSSDLLVSFGTGGGGGGDKASAGWGGGGGAQVQSANFGGGGGCSLFPGPACKSSSDPDTLSSISALGDLATKAQAACKEQTLTVCVEGGGGAGVSGPSTNYGGGFSLAWMTTTRNRDYVPLSNPSSLRGAPNNQTEFHPIAAGSSPCASSSGGGAVGSISRACATQCSSEATSFNKCFCPCFSKAVVAAGLSWGSTIVCE